MINYKSQEYMVGKKNGYKKGLEIAEIEKEHRKTTISNCNILLQTQTDNMNRMKRVYILYIIFSFIMGSFITTLFYTL